MQLLMLLLLALCLPYALAACSSDGECNSGSAAGVCLPTSVCRCDVGWLGANCSIGSTSASPVFVAHLEGLLGQRILHEWRITADGTGASHMQVRWTVNRDTWFGVIIQPGYDGMTQGDSWNFYVTAGASPTIYLADSYSSGTNQPAEDAEQDLTLINAWNDGDGSMSVEFTRPFNTQHANDFVFSETGGEFVRFVWTTGLDPPDLTAGSGGTQQRGNKGKALSMHGFVGYTGMFQVDFLGGRAEVVESGIKWPRMWWIALGFLGGLLLLGCILQCGFVQRSGCGRCLRTRPLLCIRQRRRGGGVEEEASHLGATSVSKAQAASKSSLSFARSSGDELWHQFSLQFLPSLRNLSTQECFFVTVYLAFVAACIASCAADYDAIGRSPFYVLGHLALHLALILLPVTRNSVWLRLMNISFDVAIAWHRRLGYLTLLINIAHFISMLVV